MHPRCSPPDDSDHWQSHRTDVTDSATDRAAIGWLVISMVVAVVQSNDFNSIGIVGILIQ